MDCSKGLTVDGGALKILIFTPVWRLERETFDWLGKQLNATKHSCTLMLSPDDHSGNERQRICAQYRKARTTLLAGDYDALLTLESDIIPPLDAVDRLAHAMAGGYDIVMGVYVFRRGPILTDLNDATAGKPYVGDFLSTTDPAEAHRRCIEGGVYECTGHGFGCTLIGKHVLRGIEFRLDAVETNHCDWPFWCDVRKKGFSAGIHYGVQCGHQMPSGRVLWPREQIEQTPAIAERLYWSSSARRVHGAYV